MFTLDVCVCVNANVTVKIQHCINGDANTNTGIWSETILCFNICIAIDTMLNFDSDVNSNVKCEQALVISNSKKLAVAGVYMQEMLTGVVQNRRRRMKDTVAMRTITTEPVLSGHPHYSPIVTRSTCVKMVAFSGDRSYEVLISSQSISLATRFY